MSVATRVPIGDRIRTQRRSAGVTQRALAEAVGVSPAYLSLIESDKRQIGGRLLNEIAAELGVAADAFTAVAQDRLARDLAEVVRTLPERPGESAAELVGFSPDWAQLLLALHERAMTAEARAFRLADRFARDPEWTSFAHEILSRITSVRSAAEILSDGAALSDAHRKRFTDTLAAESARLTNVARDMIEALQTGTAVDAAGADVREVDAFLQDHDNYFDDIERAMEARPAQLQNSAPAKRFAEARALVGETAAQAVAGVLAANVFRTEGAARRAAGALNRYAAGAAMMPYAQFHEAAVAVRYDIDALSERFGASFEQVAHRLATLRRPGAEGLPFAFLRVDPAGTVSKRRSTAGLHLPLFGACPLWVIYDAFVQPDRVLTQMVDLDGERFLFIARALQKTPRRHASPGARYAVMLGIEAEHIDYVVYGDAYAAGHESLVTRAGYECHSCRIADCPQRAHATEEPAP